MCVFPNILHKRIRLSKSYPKLITSSCGDQRAPHPLDTAKPAPQTLLFTLFLSGAPMCS